jgi:transcriptional regulator GlxA family with amidase domain
MPMRSPPVPETEDTPAHRSTDIDDFPVTDAAPAPRWLLRAQEQLHATIEGPVTLAELAREAGVHRARLSRAFRAHFGCSVGDYHRRVRVAWAADQIARNAMPLAEISVRAGFADQSHFGRVFRRWTGLTPRQYRDVHASG